MLFVRLEEITYYVLFICLYLDKKYENNKGKGRELFIVLDTAEALNCTDICGFKLY